MELPADIMAVIKETAKQTAKAVVTEQDMQLEERRDRRLHNTQLLLKNYRKFKLHCTGAVYTDEEGDHDGSEEEEAIELLDMMMNKNRMAVVESIRMSCRRTKIIMKHIDNVLSMYEVYCNQKADNADGRTARRECQVLRRYYISDDEPTYDQIAADLQISPRQVYRDLSSATAQVSVFMFGVDALDNEP